MLNVDDFKVRETDEGDAVLSVDRSGEATVTFHQLCGNYDDPIWKAFVDGLLQQFPNLSIWNETQGRYHVSLGCRWLEYEGRYENEKPSTQQGQAPRIR